MNLAKTGLLLAAMTGLFLALGYALGGEVGMGLAFVFALGMNFFSYWNGDKLVLRMHGARRVEETEASDLFRLVSQLARNAGLPVPAVYIIEQDQPNAFATGRNPDHAAVAITTGLRAQLSREELAGVIAHELAHIQNRDILTMTITATFAGAISMLANFALFFGGRRQGPLGFVGVLAMMILAPLAAALVQMAISRTREYVADARGAEICGRPLWLASALAKIAHGAEAIENETAERNPATAPLFIINPLHGGRADRLFSTHPDTDNRIARLRAMAGEQKSVPGPWE